MATKAIVRCKKCNEEFEIYWSDMTHNPISCKQCGATMDKYMSEQFFNAFSAVVDANVELCKAHLQENKPLFEIGFSHTNYITAE